nr:hypothetical protein CFP56_79470 [Quercus suber]
MKCDSNVVDCEISLRTNYSLLHRKEDIRVAMRDLHSRFLLRQAAKGCQCSRSHTIRRTRSVHCSLISSTSSCSANGYDTNEQTCFRLASTLNCLCGDLVAFPPAPFKLTPLRTTDLPKNHDS